MNECPYCDEKIDPYDAYLDSGEAFGFRFSCPKCGKEIECEVQQEAKFTLYVIDRHTPTSRSRRGWSRLVAKVRLAVLAPVGICANPKPMSATLWRNALKHVG